MIDALKVGNIDYSECRYGASRLSFRGPAVSLERPYIAVIGGNETFGRFVRRPYPALLAELLDYPVVNLGCMNAGLTAFLEDAVVRGVASRAALTVVQILGAENMSNRYYMVHPRRNDRFLKASKRMTDAFPAVDFTEFHYTRHMLHALEGAHPEAYQALLKELKVSWENRMHAFLQAIQSPVLLLWMSERAEDETGPRVSATPPLYIEGRQVARVAPDALATVAVRPGPEEVKKLELMTYSDTDSDAARVLPGPAFHSRAASALEEAIRPILGLKKEKRRVG